MDGCVYVQPLIYEDVSACITLTLSSRLLTNVLLKTRSHTRAHVFITKTYLYQFMSYETYVCITYFPITFTGENNFWHTRQLFEHFVLTDMSARVLRLRVMFMRMFCLTRTRYSGWSERTMIHFQCKRHVSPYEAMGTRVRVRVSKTRARTWGGALTSNSCLVNPNPNPSPSPNPKPSPNPSPNPNPNPNLTLVVSDLTLFYNPSPNPNTMSNSKSNHTSS